MKVKKVILSDYINILESGGRPKGGAQEAGTIPSLGAEHLDNIGGFNFTKLKKVKEDFFFAMTKGKIDKGDILIVKDGATTGKVSLVREDFPYQQAGINEHLFRLVPTKDLDSKYLFYYLRSIEGQSQIMSDFRGATVGGIGKSFVDKISFLLPSLQTQKKMAEILDTADTLRRKDKALIEIYNQLTHSLFLEMFGDPVRNEKGWEMCKLGSLLNMVGSGSTPKGGQSVYGREGYVFIRSQNVRDNKIDYSNIYFINEKIHNQMKRTWVKNQDVLLNITGASIGRCAIFNGIDDSANVNQHVCILRLKKNLILPQFLLHHITQDNYQNIIIGSNSGGTREAFNFKQIKSFNIILPPFNLQEKFTAMVEEIEKQKQLAEASLLKSEALFNSLLHKAFKGELVKEELEPDVVEQ